jgi:DNA-binding MarR family transcriptional regulator
LDQNNIFLFKNYFQYGRINLMETKSTAQLIYDISFVIRLYGEGKAPNGDGKAGESIEKLSELESLILEIMDFKKTKMFISDFKDAYPAISKSKFSTEISKLWRKGLVEKRNDPEDQRRTIVELTKKGNAAITGIKDGQMKLYEEIARGLSLDPKKDKALYHAALERGINHFKELLEQKEEKSAAINK